MNNKNLVRVNFQHDINHIIFNSEVTKENISQFKLSFQEIIDQYANNFIIDLTNEIKFTAHALKLILSFYKSLEPLKRSLGLLTNEQTKNILESMSVTHFIKIETNSETLIEKMK